MNERANINSSICQLLNRLPIYAIVVMGAFLFCPIDMLAGTGVGESDLEGTGQAPVPRSLEELVAAPSPEAAAMLRHIDEQIDYCRGEAALSIPLYAWQSGDLSIDLSLRYHVGGYRRTERVRSMAIQLRARPETITSAICRLQTR